jgi:hypothetical protein
MNGILRRVTILMTVIALVAVPCASCFAEGFEQDEDIVAGKMAAEIVVRPLGICATVLGGAIFLVTIPFSAIGGNVGDAYNYLLKDPFVFTFNRPLGDF